MVLIILKNDNGGFKLYHNLFVQLLSENVTLDKCPKTFDIWNQNV